MHDRSSTMTEEVAAIWAFLNETLERMIAVGNDLSTDEIHWSPPSSEGNSIAVLLAHTTGSIEESILQALAGESVNRDRDAEFVERGTSAELLAEHWSMVAARLEPVFSTLDADQLRGIHVHPRRGEMSGRDVLLSALAHAREHLGQVELNRDLILASRS